MIEHDYHQDDYDHQQCAGSEQCLPTQRSQSTWPSLKRYFLDDCIDDTDDTDDDIHDDDMTMMIFMTHDHCS